jgi:DNA-binding IclR family transcriptional regulator
MTASDSDGDSAARIQSLEISSQILDYIAAAGGRRLTAAEIARGLGFTPPRVWRYLNSLEALGYVASAGPRQGFVLGGRLARLGQMATDQLNVGEVSRPYLMDLRDVLGEAVYLAVPHGNDAVVVISLDSGGPLTIRMSLGVKFLGHASASARILMAFSSEAKRERFLAGPLPADGHDPIVDAAELADRFLAIRERFFDTAETAEAKRATGTVFFNAIASPVFDHQNEVVGAVGVLTGLPGEAAVTAPHIRLPLFECAAQISQDLGATRWHDSGHFSLTDAPGK